MTSQICLKDGSLKDRLSFWICSCWYSFHHRCLFCLLDKFSLWKPQKDQHRHHLVSFFLCSFSPILLVAKSLSSLSIIYSGLNLETAELQTQTSFPTSRLHEWRGRRCTSHNRLWVITTPKDPLPFEFIKLVWFVRFLATLSLLFISPKSSLTKHDFQKPWEGATKKTRKWRTLLFKYNLFEQRLFPQRASIQKFDSFHDGPIQGIAYQLDHTVECDCIVFIFLIRRKVMFSKGTRYRALLQRVTKWSKPC
jgi:hypothetical protein